MFLILLAAFSLQAVWAGGGCTDAIKRIWQENPAPYKVWDPEVSSVAIKKMVDRNSIQPKSSVPIRIMMGMAKIADDLPVHQHRETEIYYILKGRGKSFFTTKEGRYELQIEEGSFFYLPSGAPHYTVSDPDAPIELLYVFPSDALDEVEYMFDGSLPIADEMLITGKLSPAGQYPGNASERVLIDGKGQIMKHLLLPPQGTKHYIQGSDRILFVRHGQGLIAIDGEELSLEKGAYLYLGEGASYSIQSAPGAGLDILIFE